MTHELAPALRPDFFGQLAATDPHQGRARRLFERGQVVAVNGNQADLLVGYDARNNPLELKQVPIVSGYMPRMGDWVSIQYEAGHSGAPWVTGPSMAADDASDSAGIGVFSVSDTEPGSPQTSMIYFDESHATWRGWDGADWVDFSAKLHNNLPDLQGGGGGDYFHLAADEHTALQDLQDGSGLASAWVKRLRFKAIDASASQRTQMFEVNGDFYWAVNATYDESADQWNRVDTAKYAYLIAVHSEGNIPTEPIGGVVWWRATPGANPIGDWAAVGGWELGYMMTEHRNFVMGGMNLEMDGSGAPPYGRFTHSGSNDASGTVFTAMQRNSWYEGAGQWGRDSHDQNSAIIGFDANADLFVWWFPDSSEGNAPWGTAAWQERATFHLSGDTRGRLDVIRSSADTSLPGSSFLAKHRTSGDMANGFASGYLFAVEDSAGVENLIGAMYGERAGADNTGRLSWHVASGGELAERMGLTAGGVLSIAGVDLAAGAGNGLRFWESDSYKIHMGNEAENHYGPVTGYSIKHNMNTTAGRGWTWGIVGETPVAALSNTGILQVAGQYHSPLEAHGNSGASHTINWNLGNVHSITLSASCTLTFSNPVSGGRYVLIVTKGATAYTITWPATVTWPGGTAPTITASKTHVFGFVYDGSKYRAGTGMDHTT